MFKAKAAAEAKKMQAEGLKAGEDFVGCKLFSPSQCSRARRCFLLLPYLDEMLTMLDTAQLNSRAISRRKRSGKELVWWAG